MKTNTTAQATEQRPEWPTVSVEIPRAEYDRVQALAAELGVSIKGLLYSFVKSWLDENHEFEKESEK